MTPCAIGSCGKVKVKVFAQLYRDIVVGPSKVRVDKNNPHVKYLTCFVDGDNISIVLARFSGKLSGKYAKAEYSSKRAKEKIIVLNKKLPLWNQLKMVTRTLKKVGFKIERVTYESNSKRAIGHIGKGNIKTSFYSIGCHSKTREGFVQDSGYCPF